MQMMSIASGSSGNCIYIGDEKTHILIDAGIANKRIEESLKEIGLKPQDLSGVLVTHEHSDHIKGLPVMMKKYGIPIYATRGTCVGIKKSDSKGCIDPGLFQEILPDQEVTIGSLTVRPFRVSHDAADPVAFRVFQKDRAVAVATDLGFYNDYIIENLAGLNAVLLESNHDIRMLEAGPYPYYLKKRIWGDRGHLSNKSAGELLSRILHDQMKYIFLGHLSKENNLEELAYETVRLEISDSDTPYRGNDFSIQIAGRDCASKLVHV